MPYALRALTSGIQGPGIEGFLNLVYPLTELIEVDVKTRHFVLLEGGFGGRGEFLLVGVNYCGRPASIILAG